MQNCISKAFENTCKYWKIQVLPDSISDIYLYFNSSYMPPRGEPHPAESSQSWMKWVGPDTICLGEEGLVIPSSGERPEPFSKMAFIGIGICRGIQHACIAHQSMSKGYSYKKQILSIDNNWRNTEVLLRSGSVRHDQMVIKVCFMR